MTGSRDITFAIVSESCQKIPSQFSHLIGFSLGQLQSLEPIFWTSHLGKYHLGMSREKHQSLGQDN